MAGHDASALPAVPLAPPGYAPVQLPARPAPGARLRDRASWHGTNALARSWSFARMVGLLDRLDHRSPNILSVLMYHRIEDAPRTPHLDPALISATPAEFERQMSYLAARRPLLTLEDVLMIRRGERPLPPGAVLVTFDDGYRDFAEHAWPVLRRHGVPTTLFVPTRYPGEPQSAFWWDRVFGALMATRRVEPLASPAGTLPLASFVDRCTAARVLRDWVWETPHAAAMAGVDELLDALGAPPASSAVLSWDELRELSAAGVTIAAQTRTHPMVNQLPLEAAQEEILGSMEDLHRELGAAPKVFAYPAGGSSEELIGWLRDAGFEMAFTTQRGCNDLRDCCWLQLRRINVGVRTTVPVLRTQLLSYVARPGGLGSALVSRA